MGALKQFPSLPPVATTHIAAKRLNKHSPHDIAEAMKVLIDALNLLGGDSDPAEDGEFDQLRHNLV